MKEILLSLLVSNIPPGTSHYSVETYDCVGPAESCKGPEEERSCYSSYYDSWVRKESAEAAIARYKLVIAANIKSAEKLLCVDEAGDKIKGCVPYNGERKFAKNPKWELAELVMLSSAAAIMESGLREDVMVGRGRYKRPSDCGGEGRGPGGEACFMQVHPSVAGMFTHHMPGGVRDSAMKGNRNARETIMQSLLGSDEGAITRCFDIGQRMLIHARAHCTSERRRYESQPAFSWAWDTYAMYGTGHSCVTSNFGKTPQRYRLYNLLMNMYEARMKELKQQGLVLLGVPIWKPEEPRFFWLT